MAEITEIEIKVTSDTEDFADIQTAANETSETIKRSNQETTNCGMFAES